MSELVIHVALPSDQNYVHGLKVTAASIAIYAEPETHLHFHILDGGIDDTTFAAFEAMVRVWHRHSSFSRHPIDERVFDKFPAWSKNKMTYARLLLPALLTGIDRVIYSDTDVLWLAKVEELWSLADNGAVALAGRDGFLSTRASENAWYAAKGLPCPGKDYFCAGIMVFNLSVFRRDKMIEQVFSFVRSNPDLKFADQTALNSLLYRRVTLLPRRWHTLTMEIEEGPLERPVVLHYANEVPWNRKARWGLLSDTVMLWHWFNDIFVLRRPGASLRAYYTVPERLLKRVLFKALSVPLSRFIIYAVLRSVRREAVISNFTPYLHPLMRDSILALLREWREYAEKVGQEGRQI